MKLWRLIVPAALVCCGLSQAQQISGERAANTSAKSGNKWRVHFIPDETGAWNYVASFRTGPNVAVAASPEAGKPLAPDGVKGPLNIAASDKTGRDHRAHGMLAYANEHYARYQGSGKYFIQVGTLDHGGARNQLQESLHRYEPRVKDWRSGDPTWQSSKGKGMNTFYTLTMNVEGDGREIYPWTSYEERARYDVSQRGSKRED